MTSSRRFGLTFLTLIVFWMVGVLLLAIWEQKVTGDLTRIGRWSERDFGFRRSVPAIVTLPNQKGDRSPDVAVLGDSFSDPNVWQSVTSRATGLQFQSWRFIGGKTCIKQWVDETLRQYPGIKVMIFETVERNMIHRATEYYSCEPSESGFVPLATDGHADVRSFWPLTLNPEYVGNTLVHTIEQKTRHGREVRSKVVNVPLTRRGLFSNRRDDRMLYYADDEGEWGESPQSIAQGVNNLTGLSRELERRGVKFILLMIPDKSHVYRDVMVTTHLRKIKPDFPGALRAEGVSAPDLLSIFKRQAMIDVDFYLPNDTHLSTRGFEVLGNTMATSLLATKPESP